MSPSPTTTSESDNALASLGIKKINRMLIIDYADPTPSPTFRAEIDIPLNMDDYRQLKEWLESAGERRQQSQADIDPDGARHIVKLLLGKLTAIDDLPLAYRPAQSAIHHFVSAAFGIELPNLGLPNLGE